MILVGQNGRSLRDWSSEPRVRRQERRTKKREFVA